MGKVKRVFGVAAASVLGSAGLVLATAGPAAATPNLCTIASKNINYSAGSAWTRCTAGSGWFRVTLNCKTSPDSSSLWFAAGPWVSVQDAYQNGTRSYGWCPSDKPYITAAFTQIA